MTSYRAGDEAYAEASEIAAIPEVTETETVQQPTEQPQQETQTEPEPAPSADPYAQALEQMDLPALQQVNSDVIGWIAIPGTEISYPLVQGADNDYYLTHTWNQNSSAVGAIFMDCRCSADFSGFNTIVYGHRMNNGSMVCRAEALQKAGFPAGTSAGICDNASGTHAYRIYAAYEAALDGTAYYSAFSDETIKKTFIDEGISLVGDPHRRSTDRKRPYPHAFHLHRQRARNPLGSAGGHGIKNIPLAVLQQVGCCYMLLFFLVRQLGHADKFIHFACAPFLLMAENLAVERNIAVLDR